ncbi:MAG: methyltransferase domain-containing protein [Nitrospira sp.]|uniref:Ubiquinone/menaquinone biosynthesis methyltransferase UbiE n=1 Tax=Nitrospira defluvii TaxID=330214 RepID=A0ABN7LRD9_9BACT|nr:methyltransferase domain-containing protein [Nitrospira defluvii]MCS6326675.1 methyltransferase domain-containing protein [Nitrospira sp.]CAE6756573.1 Putative Ubiquinone/menaquinone biosynthesis methyltransferase UbiE [Nitrospira defluvii]
MPTHTPEAVIEAQRQDWNRVAPGWDKWDQFFNRTMAFINHRLVADARVRPGLRVLDLGSGTGYPAILAGEVVGAEGTVIGIDLAESMLAVATRKAKTLGLQQVSFRTGDVTSLPFETGSIDAVISRFCLMFLPDIPKAAGEIARVLKPGGYVAAAVWSSPDKNPFIRIPMDIIKSITPLPPPDPEAPGIFRLAKPGDLAGMLQRAGLTPLDDEEFTAEVAYESGEEFFRGLMDIAAPIQNLFAQLTPAQQVEAEQGIIKAVNDYRGPQGVALPIAVRIVSARKPR